MIQNIFCYADCKSLYMIAVTKLSGLNVLGARFTKQGILTLDPNSIKAQMGGETSAGDLLTSCTH